ncbi:MAG TPA: hypothetical protein VEK11_15310 [Thermoanaerobaculia bacterium]|nr:hypothetical protein [Thermoanaerobaculia bacterium]
MTKRLAIAAVLFCTVALPMRADFSSLARALDRHQGVKRVWIPFLGLARVAVRIVEPEGVHDFQLATFTGADKVDARELQQMMRTHVGAGFKPLVQVWSRKSNEWSFIYAKPVGDNVELMILAHDDEDTVLVRVSVNADKVAEEIGRHPRRVTNVARR